MEASSRLFVGEVKILRDIRPGFKFETEIKMPDLMSVVEGGRLRVRDPYL